jgi:hypothetical protein
VAAEDRCGVSRALLSGGSAIAAKLTGAAVLSAVSMVTLLPPPHGAVTGRGGSQHPARGGVSALERATASSSPSTAASWRLAVRSDARGNLAFPAAFVAHQHAPATGRPAQPRGSGQMSWFRNRRAGERASVGGRGSSGAASTGATGLQPAAFPIGSSEPATGPTRAGGQRSGAGSPAGGPSGVYGAAQASPGQQRAPQPALSTGQAASAAG